MIQYGRRNKRLKELGYSSYQEYLKSEDWQNIKIEWEKRKIKNPKHWGKCQICETTERLVLHHLKYGKVEKLTFSKFMTLCNSCHNEVHKIAHSPGFKGSIKSATRRYLRKYNNARRLHTS